MKHGVADNHVHYLNIFQRRGAESAEVRGDIVSFFHGFVFFYFLILPFSPSSLRTSATFAPLRLVFLNHYIVWLRPKGCTKFHP